MLPTCARPYMPHDLPMALIDDIIACDEQTATTRVTITQESLFLDAQQRISVLVGIEYMAQSAAAWSGYNNKHGSTPSPIGMLLGTRHYQSNCAFFSVGDVLTVVVACLLQSADGMSSFDCSIERDGRIIASASLTVFQPNH